MKPIKYIAVISLCLSTITACKKALKNVDDYYPVVETAPATVTAEGSVEVKAIVRSEGDTPLQFIGFCMDTLPVPDMMSNQVVVNELNGAEFSAVYDIGFDPAKTYYFRSWAANDAGYTYGNVISLTGIEATPVSAPCELKENSSNTGLNFQTGSGPAGSVYQVTAVDNFSGTWEIKATGYDSQAGTLNFRFGSQLKTKIFTTTEGNAYGDFVHISVSSGFTSGTVKSGAKVYVNQQSVGVYEITLCETPWLISGSTSTLTLNARFVSPL